MHSLVKKRTKSNLLFARSNSSRYPIAPNSATSAVNALDETLPRTAITPLMRSGRTTRSPSSLS